MGRCGVNPIKYAILGCALAFFASGCLYDPGQDPVMIAISRIQIGDERSKAIQALSNAWYHAECTLTNGSIDDLFFYGPQNSNVKVVIVRSKIVQGKLAVYFVGSEESYMLHLQKECIPAEILNKVDPQQ
ncbi:MAG: hypothetical protein EXR62_10095 [Chloroflexi bacterium]|nr:hypothetical protein [Chloroflexota bacterium]